MLTRIQADPNVCEGKATIRGLRITVEFVLRLVGDGYTAAEIVQRYPELETEDVYQSAKYGAWLASEHTSAQPQWSDDDELALVRRNAARILKKIEW